MGIPVLTFAQMGNEGITTVDDLGEYDKTGIEHLADNLRRPPGRVPDPDGGGGTIPTPAFTFGVRSQQRLTVACDLVRYYTETGRSLTVANLQWTSVMKNFSIQWKALKDRQKDEDDPDVPKITKTLQIMKWTEAFQDFCDRIIGSRMIPLSYVIRDDVAVPVNAPALAANQPYSDEHGSVEGELVARASHTHPLYRDDNAKVYYYLGEATRSTPYAASIKPFQRRKDGRGAWTALVAQYAGKDKWEAEIKKQEQLLHNRKWKAQGNFSLEGFVSSHRNAYVSMQACAEHVQYQLPNEHSRVGLLLQGIECSDAGLQAAMASVRTNDGPNGMRNDFEAAVAHLLPYDPVAKKRTENKRGSALISTVDGETAEIGSATKATKASIGKTGVHLRYHKQKDYVKLSPEMKLELKEWRESQTGGKGGGKKDGKPDGKRSYTKKQISSLISEQVSDQFTKMMESVQGQVDEEKSTTTAPAVADATATKAATNHFILKSILKKSKN